MRPYLARGAPLDGRVSREAAKSAKRVSINQTMAGVLFMYSGLRPKKQARAITGRKVPTSAGNKDCVDSMQAGGGRAGVGFRAFQDTADLPAGQVQAVRQGKFSARQP